MRVENRENLLLSDTAIPDIFISDYMTGLSEWALKVYLYIAMAANKDRVFSASVKDISGRIGMDDDRTQAALMELVSGDLIEWNNKGKIRLADLKAWEVEGFIVRRKNASVRESVLSRPEDEKQSSLAKSIEKTFFHGSMSYPWYSEIDVLLQEFGFETEVVYHLFRLCYEKKKLSHIHYLHGTAVEWQKRQIVNMEALNRFLLAEDVVQQTMKVFAKRLRRRMTEYDEEVIRAWTEKYSYSCDIMEYAIRKTAEFRSTNNLSNAESLLESWFLRNLMTLSEIQAFESDKAEENKKRYQGGKKSADASGGAGKKDNFQAAVYDEEFLKGLEMDPDEYIERLEKRLSEKP